MRPTLRTLPRPRAALAALCLALASCSHDSYDAGEGALSRLRADFAVAATNSYGAMTTAVTDDGARLLLEPPISAPWGSEPDTTYRALLYYVLPSDTTASTAGAITVSPRAAQQVMMLTPRRRDGGEAADDDPVSLQSVWMSANGRFLNIAVDVKVGTIDDPANRQVLGLAEDSVTTDADGTVTSHWRLLHRQNGMPQYYSQTVYLSVAVPAADSTAAPPRAIALTVNDTKGTVTRRLAVP